MSTMTKAPRARRAKAAQLTPTTSAGDSLPHSEAPAQAAPASVAQVALEVRGAANPAEMLKADNVRLQKLLRETQAKLADATKDDTPPEPIADGDLKPLLAEHVRTGASIGRHALTPEQKLLWKATKKARKALVNGRVYRKRIIGNVTRAANEGAFSRYRERVAAKSKRLAGFTLGAAFKAPKASKKE